MKNSFVLSMIAAMTFGLLATPSCRQQPQTRQYEEKGSAVVQAPKQPPRQLSQASWRWDKPLLWQEEKGDGLRLVTFLITGREGSAECALVALPGDGGGVEANVQRWLEQLNLPLFSPAELDDFITRQKKMRTESGLLVTVIDFTTLNQPQKRLGTSLLVAILASENQTLFIKMSGGKALLGENREVFYKFCQSLSLGA
jgi:hypothetical protein